MIGRSPTLQLLVTLDASVGDEDTPGNEVDTKFGEQ